MVSHMMLLKKAHEYFKLGLYDKALKEYELYSVSSESTKIDVSLNIALCRKRLMGERVGISGNPNDDHFLELLGLDLADSMIIQKQDGLLIDFFKKIKINNIQEISSKEALNILRFSPFQISLLLFLAYILCVRDKRQDQLFEISSKSLNLATLIRSVIDYRFWLDNKIAILSKMDEMGVVKNGKFLGDGFRPFSVSDIANYQNLLRTIRNVSKYSNGVVQFCDKKSVHFSIGSILLNESKFIALNLIGHYDICDEWVLVEGACQGYPTRKVTDEGLSLDNSAIQIMLFPDLYNKIRFIQYGWTDSTGEEAKSELRNQYLKYVTGDILLVLDIDEFYSLGDIKFALKKFKDNAELTALTLPQVHFWKGTGQFVTGGYYDISHTRFFRNIFGMKYISNHNFPEINGVMLNKINHQKEPRVVKELKNNMFKYEGPRCYHMGFSKDEDDMRDKTDYYVNRGEAITRKNTTDSRAGWFDDKLPVECKIRKWGGGLPYVLQKNL